MQAGIVKKRLTFRQIFMVAGVLFCRRSNRASLPFGSSLRAAGGVEYKGY